MAAALAPEPVAIRPQDGPQETFLSCPADVAVMGGSVYGGKTWALAVEPLRHVGVGDFTFVVFRRTTPEIRNPGGLWDETQKWYPLCGADPREGTLDWRFPSGAAGKLAGLQYEKDVTDWKGAQICLLEFDQLEEFTETQFFYLLSRNRSMCGVRPYTRASCNPDADSWLAGFIAWWWDQETGYAIPERSGAIRWFLRVDEAIEWSAVRCEPHEYDRFAEREAEARAELLARFGTHYAGPDGAFAKSFAFVLARLQDNIIGRALDPGYEANVRLLPPVEQERLLGGDKGGNWKIRPAAGLVFNRAWFEIVDAVPVGARRVRGWDFAATAGDGDWTAGVRMGEAAGTYYVEDVVRGQWDPGTRDGVLAGTTAQDGSDVTVRMPQDPGAAGVAQVATHVKLLAGYSVVHKPISGDKATRAGGFAAQAKAGNVKLLRGAWNEAFLRELHAFPTKGVPDDQVDASADAFNELALGDQGGLIAYYAAHAPRTEAARAHSPSPTTEPSHAWPHA